MDYQTNVGMLEVRLFDNETGYGFLINQPGISPVIYLNRTLLGEDSNNRLYQEVHKKLLHRHHSMNIWERVMPFRVYYEEIIFQENVILTVKRRNRNMIFGRFLKATVACEICESRVMGYRLIG